MNTKGIIKRHQRVVLYGPEGVGKTTLGSKFPKPTFIDLERGSDQLDVDRRNKPVSWHSLQLEIKKLIKNKEGFETLIIETAERIEQMAADHIVVIKDAELSQDIASITDIPRGNGIVFLEEILCRFYDLLSDLCDSGMHVVLTAHAVLRKVELPNEEGAYDKWEPALSRRNTPKLVAWPDMVLFCNYKVYVEESGNKHKAKGGAHIINTTNNPCWIAKNRHGLPPEIELKYDLISHCFMVSAQEESKPIDVTPPKAEETKDDIRYDYPAEPEEEENYEKEEALAIEQGNIPRALFDLMVQSKVTEHELRYAVDKAGHMPMDTKIEDYDKIRPGLVDGLLIANWPKVVGRIKSLRETGEL